MKQVWFILALFSALAVYLFAGVKGLHATLTPSENQVAQTVHLYNETNKPEHIAALRDLISNDPLDGHTVPIIQSNLPVDKNTIPIYLDLLESESLKVSFPAIASKIKKSQDINQFPIEQIERYSTILESIEAAPGDYSAMHALQSSKELVKNLQQGIKVTVEPLPKRNSLTPKERVQLAIQRSENTNKELGIPELSEDYKQFLQNVRMFNITGSPVTFQEILLYHQNHPGVNDSSRWLGTRLEVNQTSISLILGIAEDYFENSDILLNSSLGLMVLHIVQSGYLEQADLATRERFLALLEAINSTSIGEIHGFTQKHVREAIDYVIDLPESPGTTDRALKEDSPTEVVETQVVEKAGTEFEKETGNPMSADSRDIQDAETSETKETRSVRWIWLVLLAIAIVGIGIALRRKN